MITIVGAGMAGLLAARMLARYKPVVYEAQEALPNNHSAILRFRSPSVGDITGIPFKKVNMIKGYLPWKNPVADMLAYSRKVSGESRSDRSILTANGFETHERYIAPPDFINQLAEGVDIKFKTNYDRSGTSASVPIISTIPMPALMRFLGYEKDHYGFSFGHVAGHNLSFRLHKTDAYVSMYVPDPQHLFNRVSVTGDLLIAEYANIPLKDGSLKTGEYAWITDQAKKAADVLGFKPPFASLMSFREQHYAKILPVDDGERKAFIAWASDQHNIFSLGRYATWRPGLLLDDLVKDIRLIEGWINSDNSRYAMRRHRA